MPFDPRAIEAKLALNRISTVDMPKLACDALEAGLDGPAIRRLASLEFPTFFQIREVLPQAMNEMGLSSMRKEKAALRLAMLRAREILNSHADPFPHLADFAHLWSEADYCRELEDYGNLHDEVYIAKLSGQPEEEIRAWLLQRLNRLATCEG